MQDAGDDFACVRQNWTPGPNWLDPIMAMGPISMVSNSDVTRVSQRILLLGSLAAAAIFPSSLNPNERGLIGTDTVPCPKPKDVGSLTLNTNPTYKFIELEAFKIRSFGGLG